MRIIERLEEQYQNRKLQKSPDNPLDALNQMIHSGDVGPYRDQKLRNQLYAVGLLSETNSPEALQILKKIYTPVQSREIVGQKAVAFYNPDTYYEYYFDLHQVYPGANGPLGQALEFKFDSGSYDDFTGDSGSPEKTLSWEDILERDDVSDDVRRVHKIMQMAIKSLEDKLASKE